MWVIFALSGGLLIGGCQGDKSENKATSSQTSSTQTLRTDATAPTDYTVEPIPARQQPDEFPEYVPPTRQPQELTLVSMPVNEAPTIDGYATESLWNTAPAISTLDYSSQRPITLQSVYTASEVFFLVTYPVAAPSETHKTWTWDAKEEIYREGPDREDVFVFKWSMSGNDVNLALREPEPHHADIWFWKAKRSNPAGYADDKTQYLSLKAEPDSVKIQSEKHGTLYFRRLGDAGKAPYQERYFYTYLGDRISQYDSVQPQASRGDVRAKGAWHDGQWTIEFARKLDTGHEDDIAFAPGSVYLFGVGCYAMAYDTPHPQWSQSLYRTGDVFDRLFFTMFQRDQQ
jgi:hypothetical protein